MEKLNMKYLIRAKGEKVAAHLWRDGDTACRMWSTGGMNHQRDYRVLDSPGAHKICTMCQKNAMSIAWSAYKEVLPEPPPFFTS